MHNVCLASRVDKNVLEQFSAMCATSYETSIRNTNEKNETLTAIAIFLGSAFCSTPPTLSVAISISMQRGSRSFCLCFNLFDVLSSFSVARE